MEIKLVGGSLGAEVHGVDLNNLSDDENEAVLQAFADHLVLFFPGQNLTHEGHHRFASLFGELEVNDMLVHFDEDFPEIVVLDSADTPTADVWHTDVTFRESPPITSILNMVKCPPVGGDTMWINLYDAYEGLSAPMKEMLEGMTAIHVNTYGEGHAEHPVVRIHPQTGRKSLYVNRIFTKHIRQLSRPESDILLPFLIRWCEQGSFSVRHRWSAGDVAMWDNRCTLHSVANDFEGQRIIQRITVLGDKPVGVGEPRWAKHKADTNGASDFYGTAYPF